MINFLLVGGSRPTQTSSLLSGSGSSSPPPGLFPFFSIRRSSQPPRNFNPLHTIPHQQWDFPSFQNFLQTSFFFAPPRGATSHGVYVVDGFLFTRRVSVRGTCSPWCLFPPGFSCSPVPVALFNFHRTVCPRKPNHPPFSLSPLQWRSTRVFMWDPGSFFVEGLFSRCGHYLAIAEVSLFETGVIPAGPGGVADGLN